MHDNNDFFKLTGEELTEYIQQAFVGKRVSAIALTDMSTDKPVRVEGILTHRYEWDNDDLYYVEADDKRHIRITAKSIELLPEKTKLGQDIPVAYMLSQHQTILLREIVSAAIPFWERERVCEYVVNTLQPMDAAGLLECMGLIEIVNIEPATNWAKLRQAWDGEAVKQDAPTMPPGRPETATTTINGVEFIKAVDNICCHELEVDTGGRGRTRVYRYEYCTLPLGHEGDHQYLSAESIAKAAIALQVRPSEVQTAGSDPKFKCPQIWCQLSNNHDGPCVKLAVDSNNCHTLPDGTCIGGTKAGHAPCIHEIGDRSGLSDNHPLKGMVEDMLANGDAQDAVRALSEYDADHDAPCPESRWCDLPAGHSGSCNHDGMRKKS